VPNQLFISFILRPIIYLCNILILNKLI